MATPIRSPATGKKIIKEVIISTDAQHASTEDISIIENK